MGACRGLAVGKKTPATGTGAGAGMKVPRKLGREEDLGHLGGSVMRDRTVELLKRSIEAAADDPRPGISGEEMKAELREKRKVPLPEPARWEKRSRR